MSITYDDGRCDACKIVIGPGGDYKLCPCGRFYVDGGEHYERIAWAKDGGPDCAVKADETDDDYSAVMYERWETVEDDDEYAYA